MEKDISNKSSSTETEDTLIKPDSKGNPKNEKNKTSTYRDLCKTCKNLKSCSFSSTEGGVWHCKDYEENF